MTIITLQGKLLDKLLALSYSSHDDELLFSQMQLCSTKILLRYKESPDIFDDLLTTVEQHLENNIEPFMASQRDNQSRLETEETRRLTQASIQTLIQSRTHVFSRKLRFHILLEKIWLQILTNIAISHGKESQEWKIANRLLDVITLLSNNSCEQFEKLSGDLSSIAKAISKLLISQNFEQEWINTFIDQFLELQKILASNTTLSDLDDDDLSHTFAIDMIIDDYDSEMVADIETDIIGHEHQQSKNINNLILIPELKRLNEAQSQLLVENLQLGQWMIFIIDGEKTPAVMSYLSHHSQAYTFCDRHHQKLFERTKPDIVKDITSGLACPLENTLSFEGNLSRVMSRLKLN